MPKTKGRDGISIYRGHFRISYIDAYGRRRQEKCDALTLPQAQAIRAKKLADAEKQRVFGYAPPTRDTFAEFTPRYLKHQKVRLTPKAYEGTRGIIEGPKSSSATRRRQGESLLSIFGSRPLAEIRRVDVEQYVTRRRAIVSKASVAKELNVLKHMLALAVGWELVPANPAQGVKPYEQPPAWRLRYLQPTEMPGLLAECPKWLRPMVLLLVSTGMRRGELLGLRWLDLYRRGNQILLPQTKNGKARPVWLNSLACRVIDSLPFPEDARPSDLVFAKKQYFSPENVSIQFHRACRRAKIENFRLHDLRHTTASWMAMRGTDIHTIATQLGHDVKQAARYAHLSPSHLQKAVCGVDTVFGPELAQEAVLTLPADTDRIPIDAINGD